MTPRRPGWWPAALWPGDDPPEPPGGLPERPGRREDGEVRPVDSFLRAVTAAFGAEGASVYRLDRERASWVVERRVGDPPAGSSDEIAAAGHPLTWCLREELSMQSEAAELLGGGSGGWALAGAVPGADRALVVCFGGSPPTGARQGLEAAVEHLAALHEAGAL